MRVPFLLRPLVALALIGLGAYGLAAEAPPDRADHADRSGAGHALVLDLDGAVGPASADFITRGIAGAEAGGASLVILRIDTPGGLDTSMRDIIRAILASPVPVASWVGPSGARAASAGTYILYASHIAAMAPGTNLGAATPVAVGAPQPFGGDRPGGKDEESSSQNDDKARGTDAPDSDSEAQSAEETPSGEPRAPGPESPAEAKAINDAVAYIRGLAELHGRNADWAERAVREAASLSANAAAREGVIDFVAETLTDLLDKTDGRTVKVSDRQMTLSTAGLPIRVLEPDWRTRILAIITNPNIALIFMMIGIYGLIFEFMNPGALVPGTVGAISLIIGLYSLAVLPISFAGIALMILGIALILAEAFAPSFGILGIGGTIALVLGATILVDPDVPGMQISWPVLAAIGTATLAFSLLVARLALVAHRHRVVSGREAMIGLEGMVVDWEDHHGHVFVHGERWKAMADRPLSPGDRIEVMAVDALQLSVRPLDSEPSAGAGS